LGNSIQWHAGACKHNIQHSDTIHFRKFPDQIAASGFISLRSVAEIGPWQTPWRGRAPRGSGPSEVQNNKICCGFFWIRFLS